jgi:hypothetical protein
MNILRKVPGERLRIFQLYLVSFMRAPDAALERAWRELCSTESEMKSIQMSLNGTGLQLFGGPSAEFYEDFLGKPMRKSSLSNENLPKEFHSSEAWHFELPIWQGFNLVVNVLPDGRTFDSPSFRRSPLSVTPTLNSISDLVPWKFVKDELDSRFGTPQFGDAWDYWEDHDYLIPMTRSAQPQKCAAVFDFNLFQEAKHFS